jgi:hypothetical protein
MTVTAFWVVWERALTAGPSTTLRSGRDDKVGRVALPGQLLCRQTAALTLWSRPERNVVDLQLKLVPTPIPKRNFVRASAT